MVTLTKMQQEAVDFMGSSKPFLILSGSAGTGKTTAIAEFSKNTPILLTAPTHKAVQVLRTKNNHAECSTIHSALKMKRKLVGRNYQFVFDERTYARFPIDHKVVVVDEASMVSVELINAIEYVGKKYGTRFIFVGDRKQLPPVNEVVSPIFTRDYPEYELTEIIRQAKDNDIIWLSRNLDHLSTRKNGENFKFVDSKEVPFELLVESNGGDLAKFITWTNSVVTKVNTGVRKMIYGPSPAQVEISETIMLKEPFGDYKNNEEVEIASVDEAHFTFRDVIIPYPEIDIIMLNKEIRLVAEHFERKHKANLESLIAMCKAQALSWTKFYAYKESFADFQYNHAITVHRSQGSTYANSIINIADIQRNPNADEREKMLYTAITRASNKNYLF